MRMHDIPLRTEIAKAIIKAFERSYKQHGSDYDPDTCYEAADEVVGVIAGKLLDRDIEVIPDPMIGPSDFKLLPQ